MRSETFLPADTVSALSAGATLLTGTNRLARELRSAYNLAKEQCNETVWATPEITSFGNWLNSIWQDELCFRSKVGQDAILLSRIQEETVWERVVRDWCKQEGRQLMQLAAAAESARTAYALLHDWHLPMPTLDIHPNDDARAFIAWKEAFESWCDANGRISAARLPRKISDAFRNNLLNTPDTIHLAGFEEQTPAQQDILDTLQNAGSDIQRLESPDRIPNVNVATCVSPETEIETCAQWIHRHLEANPEQTIGVVVPDLSQRHAHIARVFEDVLSPELALPGASPQRHVNFSLGPPLADYPLVATALNALSLLQGGIELNPLGSLLRSPFIGGGESEAQPRALLDVRLRSLGERNVRLKWLIEQAGIRAEGRSWQAPNLESKLKRIEALSENLPSKQGPAQWAKVFEDTLEVLGWPGERTLSSAEHQVQMKWKGLLDMFVGLDDILDPLTLREAMARLRRLAAKATFQPASDSAPVQVMGFLEATGAQFDALWVIGLTDSQLPGLPHPHPLLPLQLQREHNTPHSSPSRELDFAQRQLTGLVGAAPEVILSFAQKEDDTENVPSPLLRPYVRQPFVSEGTPPLSFVQIISESAESEEIEDDVAPAFAVDKRASGGAGILKSQAACPFQAFAKHRLHARQLDEAQDGLNSRDQGTMVHEALERLWNELGDQKTLLELPPNKLSALKKRVVEEAVNVVKEKRPATFTPTFSALQKRMLEDLLDGWIEQEKTRSSFRVLETEKELLDQQIGNLTINRLVLDRIDELVDSPDHSRVIVDYKTGGGRSRGAWKGSRLEEPQLPLYTSLTDGNISGVLFANVKPDDPKWSGHTRDDGVLGMQKAYPSGSGKSEWEELYPDWNALLNTWQRDLVDLANAYVAGDARVDPKNTNTSCKYCHLSAACRITELTEQAGGWLVGVEDEDDDE